MKEQLTGNDMLSFADKFVGISISMGKASKNRTKRANRTKRQNRNNRKRRTGRKSRGMITRKMSRKRTRGKRYSKTHTKKGLVGGSGHEGDRTTAAGAPWGSEVEHGFGVGTDEIYAWMRAREKNSMLAEQVQQQEDQTVVSSRQSAPALAPAPEPAPGQQVASSQSPLAQAQLSASATQPEPAPAPAPGPSTSSPFTQPEPEPEPTPDITWMFADAGIPGFKALARRNPIRWRLRPRGPPLEIAKTLKALTGNDAKRPILLKFVNDDSILELETPASAALWIESDGTKT
jgi:hypothetical protein